MSHTPMSTVPNSWVYHPNEDQRDQIRRAVPQAPARVTAAQVEDMIMCEQYHRWPGSTMISCAITLKNGHMVTGQSRPQIEAEFDTELGKTLARKHALEEVWSYAIFLQRQRAFEA